LLNSGKLVPLKPNVDWSLIIERYKFGGDKSTKSEAVLSGLAFILCNFKVGDKFVVWQRHLKSKVSPNRNSTGRFGRNGRSRKILILADMDTRFRTSGCEIEKLLIKPRNLSSDNFYEELLADNQRLKVIITSWALDKRDLRLSPR
jgi:hypothetical protein